MQIIDQSITQCKSDANSILVTAPHIEQEKYWKAKAKSEM